MVWCLVKARGLYPRHEDVLGSGCVAPRTPDLCTRWSWVVSFTTRLPHPQGKRPQYPLDRRLGGGPKPFWTQWHITRTWRLRTKLVMAHKSVLDSVHSFTLHGSQTWHSACDFSYLTGPDVHLLQTKLRYFRHKSTFPARWLLFLCHCQTENQMN